MTLTEFLLARIDEEEAAARAVEDGSGEVQRAYYDRLGVTTADGSFDRAYLTIDPARVLSRCKADRQIVAIHRHADAYGPSAVHRCPVRPARSLADSGTFWETDPCHTLRALALPYADHPDYHEEWAL